MHALLYMIIITWVAVGCSNSQFAQSGSASQRTTELSFAQSEEIPFVNIGLIGDNSSSLLEEQQKVANSARDLVVSFAGRNLRFYLLSTTPHSATFSNEVNHTTYVQSMTELVNGEYKFKPLGLSTSNIAYSSPLFHIAPESIVFKLDGIEHSTMGAIREFDEIRMKNQANRSLTPGGEPIVLKATDSIFRVNQIAEQVRQEILALGVDGLENEYTLCSAYQFAKKILPANEPATILSLTDSDDQSGRQCFDETTLHRTQVYASNPSMTNQSECSSEGGDKDCYGDIQHQYIYVSKWPIFEFTGKMNIDGTVVDVVNRRVQNRTCWEDYNGQLHSLCDATSFPAEFDVSKYGALAGAVGAVEGSITSARVIDIPPYTWGHSLTFISDLYPDDLRNRSFTFGGDSYLNLTDYIRKRIGFEPNAGFSFHPYRSRWNNSVTRWNRTYDFGNVGLNTAYEQGEAALRQQFTKEIAKVAEERFPAFLYSSIQMLPEDVNTPCNASGNGSAGTLLTSLASTVDQSPRGSSSVQSICSSSYELQEIKDFGDHFLLEQHKVSGLEVGELINSVSIRSQTGEVTILKTGDRNADLSQYGALVDGNLIKMNLSVVQEILGVKSLDSLSEEDRSRIGIIVGIVKG